MSLATALSALKKVGHNGNGHKESELESALNAKPTEQQVHDIWDRCIGQLSDGIGYRDNMRTAVALHHDYGTMYGLSEQQLNEAAAMGTFRIDYNRMNEYVLSGNTSYERPLRRFAHALGIPEAEIDETLRIGAMKEGAVYAAKIAEGHPEYKNRLEGLVRLGFPAEGVEKVLAIGPRLCK
ncbi:MAG: hypothetical protein V1702_03855 [Candidatus Woesearchaeota archaeon]